MRLVGRESMLYKFQVNWFLFSVPFDPVLDWMPKDWARKIRMKTISMGSGVHLSPLYLARF